MTNGKGRTIRSGNDSSVFYEPSFKDYPLRSAGNLYQWQCLFEFDGILRTSSVNRKVSIETRIFVKIPFRIYAYLCHPRL